MSENTLFASWIENRGPSCTSAALLAALGGLGVPALPDLEAMTRLLAGAPFAAPGLLDYVSWPGRRAPLDLKLEALARERGVAIRSASTAVLPFWPLHPRPGGFTVVHLAWGQEAPGHWGSWGWRPFHPATYSTGGHSVVLARVEGRRWTVLDPNLPGPQAWTGRGVATAVTRLQRGSPQGALTAG